jgi:protein SCO1/2
MTESPRVPALPLRTLAVLAACLVAAGGGALIARQWLAGPDAPPTTETAAVYAAPRPLPPFELVAHDGSRFDRARLTGRYTLVLFGFTNCPDLCPTTLLELARAERLLEDLPEARRPAVVMVSVDPQRDTPEVLGRYVPHFDPRFLGVSGPDEAIAAFALALGAAYQRGTEVDGSYTVDHTAAVFLIDPEARLAAVFPTPHLAKSIAADYRRILAAGSRG